MNKVSKSLDRALALLAILLATLFSNLNAEILYVVNSQSRTLSVIDTSTDLVNNSFAMLGNVPNKIVVDAEHVWAVNSGDNAVQKISRSTGASLGNIHIGVGSNPWDAIKHEDNLYVTGLFTGKVYRVDTLTGTVTGNVTVGTAPEALHVLNGKLYVSNAGNYSQNYAGSSVSVIDLETFSLLSTIPVRENPQYLASHGGMLHVSCTGNWTDIAGAICIIDPQTDSLVQTIELGGTPGGIWITGHEQALVADSNGAHLYSYNPQTYEIINSAANPLSNGGSEVVGNGSFVAILSPNWGANGTVKILHRDLNPWKQYTVAMMPTDLKLAPAETSVDEYIQAPAQLTLYPNPLRRGEKLEIRSSEALQARLEIFNLRGQRIATQEMAGSSSLSLDLGAPAGIYFYLLSDAESGRQLSRGKFLIVQ